MHGTEVVSWLWCLFAAGFLDDFLYDVGNACWVSGKLISSVLSVLVWIPVWRDRGAYSSIEVVLTWQSRCRAGLLEAQTATVERLCHKLDLNEHLLSEIQYGKLTCSPPIASPLPQMTSSTSGRPVLILPVGD